MSATAFLALLEAGDVEGLRTAWHEVAPHLPQPRTRVEAEIIMHMARTSTRGLSFRRRAWSHRWLTEREYPSQLPNEMRPVAERMYPVIAEGVGICVTTNNPAMQPVVAEVRKAMEDAVEEAYADGRTDTMFVRQRMGDARSKAYKTLLGRV